MAEKLTDLERLLPDETCELAAAAFERAWDEAQGYSHETRMYKAVSAMRQSLAPAFEQAKEEGRREGLYAANPAHPRIRGRCPRCHAESLFLGSGGYVTCSVIGCKDPGAAHDMLSGEAPPAAAAPEQTPERCQCGHLSGLHDGGIGPCMLCAMACASFSPAPAVPERAETPQASKIHVLKTWPQFYAEVIAGRKKFELRYNDRGFQVGDCLVLQEFDPNAGYSGEMSSWRVLYMMPASPIGSHVIMSIEPWVGSTPPTDLAASLATVTAELTEANGCEHLKAGGGCSCELLSRHEWAEGHHAQRERSNRAEAELTEARKELEKVRASRDEYKALASVGPWHNDCRPNRHKAADEIRKSQERIDALAQELTEARSARERAEQALRTLRDTIVRLWGNPEDCDDCADIEERPCQVHESAPLFQAMLDADEVLGPCVCGHHQSQHFNEDTTRCRVCRCDGFRLPPVLTPTPPPAPETERQP